MYVAHITVDRDGSVTEEPIFARAPLLHEGLSAAFEPVGVLHVSMDQAHFRRLETGWSAPSSGPRVGTSFLPATDCSA
jgi:hypothetical protein